VAITNYGLIQVTKTWVCITPRITGVFRFVHHLNRKEENRDCVNINLSKRTEVSTFRHLRAETNQVFKT